MSGKTLCQHQESVTRFWNCFCSCDGKHQMNSKFQMKWVLDVLSGWRKSIFIWRDWKCKNNHCATKTHPKGKSEERQTAIKREKKKSHVASTANQTEHAEFPFILVRLSSAKHDVLCFAMRMFLIGSASLSLLHTLRHSEAQPSHSWLKRFLFCTFQLQPAEERWPIPRIVVLGSEGWGKRRRSGKIKK